MLAVDFPESNLTLVGPKKLAEANGETDAPDPFGGVEIYDLHVFTDGMNVISCWQLEEWEWDELKRNGGKIYFRSLTGHTQAPMQLHISSPLPPLEEQVVTVDMMEGLATDFKYDLEELKEYFRKLTMPGEAWKMYWRLKAAL